MPDQEIFREVRRESRSSKRARHPGRAVACEADVTPDVARLRETLGLSQPRFACLLGISERTLQNWEQGRRKPTGPARVLLRLAARHPHLLIEPSDRVPAP